MTSAAPCPPYRPAWWLPGPHLQTLWPFLFRPPTPAITPERLETPDGDFLDLAWCGDREAPVVLVLHGLEGGLDSHYARRTLAALAGAGYHACLLQFRGCSGEPNRLARSYHSGETGDLAFVLEHLASTARKVQAAIGFSLGGNVLLKWLGETGADATIRCAMAVSVPYDLGDAADRMASGLSRIYQHHLLSSLRAKCRHKFAVHGAPTDRPLSGLRTFRAFDHHVTAPVHGFAGVDDYYTRCSSRGFLQAIEIPTLLLHARNDPFMYPRTLPATDEVAASVTREIVANGGHVGFVTGRWPWQARCWFTDRLLAWLGEYGVR